jgi:hypothetical protein
MVNRSRRRLVGLTLNIYMTKIFKHDRHMSASLRRHKESSRKVKQMRRSKELDALKKGYDDSHRKN